MFLKKFKETKWLDSEIWRLTWPAVLSNLSVPILGITDTAISGRMGSADYMASMAVGAMMCNIALWLFVFLRMGTSGLTAQSFGRRNKRQCEILLSQSVSIGMIIGFMLICFKTPLVSLLTFILHPESNILNLATEYFLTCIWGAPAILGTLSILGWFLGMQTTFWPMIITIFTTIVNIVVSVTLVFYLDLGFLGVAYGTLVANWLSFILAIFLAGRFAGSYSFLRIWRNVGKMTAIKRFFTINTDIFLRSACIMAVSLGIVAYGSRYDAVTLATNVVIMQFFTLFSYFMDGLAFTAEALCGRFAGEHNREMLVHSIKRICGWGVLVAIFFSLLYLVLFQFISDLMTEEQTVLDSLKNYRLWIVLIPLVSVLAFIFDGVFIGMTATRVMLLSTAISTMLFFTGTYFMPEEITLVANRLMWSSFLCYLGMRGLILGCFIPRLTKLKTTYPYPII